MNKRNKVPQYVKDVYDYQTSHGRSSDGRMMDGIQVFTPKTFDNMTLPAGSLYATENGFTRLYDGNVALVDAEVFHKEMQEHIERSNQVDELTLMFIKAGDGMAMKYLRHFYNLLPAGGINKYKEQLPLESWLAIDGYNKDHIDNIMKSIKHEGNEVDATPFSIQNENATSELFTKKVNKLKLVIRYASIVFTNKKSKANPEAVAPDIDIDSANSANTNRNGFNPSTTGLFGKPNK